MQNQAPELETLLKQNIYINWKCLHTDKSVCGKLFDPLGIDIVCLTTHYCLLSKLFLKQCLLTSIFNQLFSDGFCDNLHTLRPSYSTKNLSTFLCSYNFKKLLYHHDKVAMFILLEDGILRWKWKPSMLNYLHLTFVVLWCSGYH